MKTERVWGTFGPLSGKKRKEESKGNTFHRWREKKEKKVVWIFKWLGRGEGEGQSTIIPSPGQVGEKKKEISSRLTFKGKERKKKSLNLPFSIAGPKKRTTATMVSLPEEEKKNRKENEKKRGVNLPGITPQEKKGGEKTPEREGGEPATKKKKRGKMKKTQIRY